ncbi:hypothetical protein FLT15_17965 [Paenibacillus thiaminolyticus]|uniref:hypothetical protein n=1 Tax=Paenibacillus thiaminolyticus TaxID=49283 RepID=UPI0011659DB5|nr:hypothetical protein [Paenibacillus thiaminolyticus]
MANSFRGVSVQSLRQHGGYDGIRLRFLRQHGMPDLHALSESGTHPILLAARSRIFLPPAGGSVRESGPRRRARTASREMGLAPAQEAASTDALQYIASVRRDKGGGRSLNAGQAVTGTFLLWAVTGRGRRKWYSR